MAGSNDLALLEEAHREGGGERAQGEATSHAERACDPTEHVGLVVTAQEPEPALAEANGGVELAVERQVAHVELEEGDREALCRCRVSCELQEVGRSIDSDHLDATSCKCEGCRPGPQPTSSTRMPGANARASTRNVTSCSVPLVNAFRRYAGPRNAAISSNHSGGGATPVTGRGYATPFACMGCLAPPSSPRARREVAPHAGDLVPCRQHDSVSVPPWDAPLLVVTLVVGGVVVPASTVRFEDYPLLNEGEVVSKGTVVPLERKLAHEVRHSVRDEQSARLDFERRSTRMRRAELAEQLAETRNSGTTGPAVSEEIRTEGRY